MDFPIYNLDWLGNRMLIAITAIIHVLINHPLAVGAYPLLTLFEWWGWRNGDQEWDRLTHRVLFVIFVITTSVGALTGVGIWLTTSVVAPFAIGSLLRVFFWQWFTEWLVFVAEVVLIMAYYLSWKKWSDVRWKPRHILLGATLSGFSWLTMALIVAILGFMMGAQSWSSKPGFFTAVLNPLYIPQLAFRTSFSMTTAGLFVWFCICFLTGDNHKLRERAVRLSAAWSLAWLPFCGASAIWYWRAVPKSMQANLEVALLTQAFSKWHAAFLWILTSSVMLILIYVLIGVSRPRWVPRYALLVPFVMSTWLLGHFERVREFIRKPYVIAGYMYSNGVRVTELPVLQRDGILPHSAFSKVRAVTSTNQREAGQEVFLIACSRCHTTNGVNSVTTKLTAMVGSRPWEKDRLVNFIHGMHITRTYMPPFPGNQAEAEALAVYLQSLQPGWRAPATSVASRANLAASGERND